MKKHFSLVELIVAMAIIGILLSFLLPSIGKARNTAKTVTCASQMHQIGLASELYLSDNSQYYSPVKYSAGTYYYTGILNARADFAYANNGWYGTNMYLDKQYISNTKSFMCPSSERSGRNSFHNDTNFNWEINNLANGSGIFSAEKVGNKSYLRSVHIKNPSEKMLTTDTNGAWLKTSSAGWVQVRHQGAKLNHLWLDGHGSTLKYTQFLYNPQWLKPKDDVATWGGTGMFAFL